MKKKYGLFKVLAVLLLIVVVATYFLEGRQGGKTFLALGDVFLNYLQSFYYFFDTVIFVLAVGGFYGLLNKIPVYREMLESIVRIVGGKSKLFVIITTILFALLSAFGGLNVLLLIFIPMIISIILLLGYDKLVALSATVGGVIIGIISGLFVNFKDPSNYYSVTYTTFDKLIGLDGHFVNYLPRILLFIIGLGILIWYIINHIKEVSNKGVNYNLTQTDNLLIEEKVKSSGKKTRKKVFIWPLAVILGLLIILLILGYLPWADLFGIKIFNEFHSWLSELKVGDYSILTSFISANFSAFGTWGNLGSYMMAIEVLFIFAIILILVYRIKFDTAMDSIIYGIKKMLPAAMIVGLAYCVLVCSYNHGFIETVITLVNKHLGDSPIIHAVLSILGSVLNVDLYYTTGGVFTSISSVLAEKANLSIYSVMFQSLYGLVQLCGPTSVLLIVCLTYLEVPYKTWLKYIWRLIVGLLILIVLALILTFYL